jgi:hypothetical protein
MIRLLAKRYAKLSYVFSLEVEAGKSDINAAIAAGNAKATRDLAEQLAKEADDIEANIKKVEEEEAARKETDEYKALSKQEQYEDGRSVQEEKNQAVAIMTEKRKLADEQLEKAKQTDDASKFQAGNAKNAREFAKKIRAI